MIAISAAFKDNQMDNSRLQRHEKNNDQLLIKCIQLLSLPFHMALPVIYVYSIVWSATAICGEKVSVDVCQFVEGVLHASGTQDLTNMTTTPLLCLSNRHNQTFKIPLKHS